MRRHLLAFALARLDAMFAFAGASALTLRGEPRELTSATRSLLTNAMGCL
jgi:hypothetical protein